MEKLGKKKIENKNSWLSSDKNGFSPKRAYIKCNLNFKLPDVNVAAHTMPATGLILKLNVYMCVSRWKTQLGVPAN